MDNQKDDTIGNKGFILPIVMLMMLFFAFFTVNAIQRLNDERDFLKERQIGINMDLQKNMSVIDLLHMLTDGSSISQSGELDYLDGQVTYDITTPKLGIKKVSAILHSGTHKDAFSFYYDEQTKRIIKWVD